MMKPDNVKPDNGAASGILCALPTIEVAETPPQTLLPEAPSFPNHYIFEQPVVLQQSPIWSRAIVWVLVGVTVFSVGWASIAKIDEAVPATGNLQPLSAVKEVKVPLNGVVKAVYVKDGQKVKQGDLLITLDSTTAEAQLAALKNVRSHLTQENQFYQTVTSGVAATEKLQLPEPSNNRSITALTKSRSALAAENQLYRAQITNGSLSGFTPEQQLRLQSAQAEVATRQATAELEVAQFKRQLAENQARLTSTRSLVAVSQKILHSIELAVREGAAASVQLLRQQQEVDGRQGEVAELSETQERLKLAIAQSEQKRQNTVALSMQNLLTKIAENETRIAEIDSQLNKVIVDNEKRIAETDSQISQAQQMLQYQEVRAPSDGFVFDLKVTSPGFVANSVEPILKVVPDNTLMAEVFVTNKDIGFVKQEMPVDVRIDTFPFSEFGDVKGKLVSIGSDALPPDQFHPYYRFPVKVQLDQQSLRVRDREILLQSGMAVSVNIKVRQRSVLSIFTETFTQQFDSLKSVR
jgi:HlyD family secretion protein